MASYTDPRLGCLINIRHNSTKASKQFHPDFVLIRQSVHDAKHDFTDMLLGLMFAGVPCVNSLHSMYCFLHRPWVFAHLSTIQQKWGRDKFPLLDQAFYPSCSDMINQQEKFPMVVKMGDAHSGLGKMRVRSNDDFTDVAGLISVAHTYCTLEPYIEAKFHIHVQKIGPHYRALIRRNISENWKANTGGVMLEEIHVTDRYKLWVDEVAQLFGGLDICAVQAVVGQDGKEYIFKAKDSAFILLGDTQEQDRRNIAELVLQRMNHMLGYLLAMRRKESLGSAGLSQFIKHEHPYHNNNASNSPPSRASQGTASMPPIRRERPPISHQGATRQLPPRSASAHGNNLEQEIPDQQRDHIKGSPAQNPNRRPPPDINRQPVLKSTQSQEFTRTKQTISGGVGASSNTASPSGDDTMANLKKTFAGIFGDM